jgi:predicted RNase H-like nuclease
MSPDANGDWLAGVDGCAGGWIAAFVRPQGGEARIRIMPRLADILYAPEAPSIVAVDVPIGLPGWGGRAAETLVRPLLGRLNRSVFPIPSRMAVFAETGPFANGRERYAAHRRACAIAEATSNPPKRITIQTFGILPKIREVDETLRTAPDLAARVFEVHPELAFWRLNGERALAEPKKVKGRAYEPGLALRRGLLIGAGLPAEAVNAAPLKGAGPDDLLDALACAAIARRLHAGLARPYPDPPPRDAFGLPMAIWA